MSVHSGGVLMVSILTNLHSMHSFNKYFVLSPRYMALNKTRIILQSGDSGDGVWGHNKQTMLVSGKCFKNNKAKVWRKDDRGSQERPF